jgi:hypothetical protein
LCSYIFFITKWNAHGNHVWLLFFYHYWLLQASCCSRNWLLSALQMNWNVCIESARYLGWYFIHMKTIRWITMVLCYHFTHDAQLHIKRTALNSRFCNRVCKILI